MARRFESSQGVDNEEPRFVAKLVPAAGRRYSFRAFVSVCFFTFRFQRGGLEKKLAPEGSTIAAAIRGEQRKVAIDRISSQRRARSGPSEGPWIDTVAAMQR